MEKQIEQIIKLCKEIGWDIAMPTAEDDADADVHGMIIGEDSYIEYILKHLE